MNDSFVFYKTFLDTYKRLLGPSKNGKYELKNEQLAHKYLETVCRYGIDGTYEEGDPVLDGLMEQTVFSIDKATDRYIQAIENGKKGGAPPKYDKAAIVEYVLSGHTQKEAAERYSCNVRTVRRYVQEYKNSIVDENGSYYF